MNRSWMSSMYAALHGGSTGLTRTQRASATLIVIAVIYAILATEPVFQNTLGPWVERIDVAIVGLFVLEYVLRVVSAGADPRFAGLSGRLRYMLTPFALIDLAAILPFVLGLGLQSILLRLLRLFRLLALSRLLRYSEAMRLVVGSLVARRFELMFSVVVALTMILFAAGVLYTVEGDVQPEVFGSIPRSLWWSVATLTTVGYGDALPITPLGKIFAAITSIAGIGLIAMPTGLLAAAFSEAFAEHRKRRDGRRE